LEGDLSGSGCCLRRTTERSPDAVDDDADENGKAQEVGAGTF